MQLNLRISRIILHHWTGRHRTPSWNIYTKEWSSREFIIRGYCWAGMRRYTCLMNKLILVDGGCWAREYCAVYCRQEDDMITAYDYAVELQFSGMWWRKLSSEYVNRANRPRISIKSKKNFGCFCCEIVKLQYSIHYMLFPYIISTTYMLFNSYESTICRCIIPSWRGWRSFGVWTGIETEMVGLDEWALLWVWWWW